MPSFNKRHIQQRSLEIIRSVGQVVACYQKRAGAGDSEITDRVATDLYAAVSDPADTPANYSKYYIFALFERDIKETEDIPGRETEVTGMLTVPMIYLSVLQKTDYFDPYLNGSRFERAGRSDIDEENLFIFQAIKGVVLPDLGDVQ